MVLNGYKGLECKVFVDGIRLEHVSEFKYFGCVLDESGTYRAQCSRKVANWKRVASAIRSLVNTRNLHLECAIVLHKTLLVPVLMYGNESMLWKEKERTKIRDVQIDYFRGLLDIRRMDRFPNAHIRGKQND